MALWDALRWLDRRWQVERRLTWFCWDLEDTVRSAFNRLKGVVLRAHPVWLALGLIVLGTAFIRAVYPQTVELYHFLQAGGLGSQHDFRPPR